MAHKVIYVLCACFIACPVLAGYSTRWPLSITNVPSAQDFVDLNGALQERVFAAYPTNTINAYTNMFRLNTNFPSYRFVTSAMWAVTSYLENRFVDPAVLSTWFDTNSTIPYYSIDRLWDRLDYPTWGYNLQSTGTGTMYAVLLPMVPMTNKTLIAKTYYAQRELNTTTYARVYQLSCYHPTYSEYRSSCPFDTPEYWLVCPTSDCYVSSYLVPSYSYTNPVIRSALQAVTLKVTGTAITNSSWGWMLYTGVTENVSVDWASTNWIKLANTYRAATVTNIVGGYAAETNNQVPTVAGNGVEVITMIEGKPCAMFEYIGPRVGVEIPRISAGYNAWMSTTILNTIKELLDLLTVVITPFESIAYTNHLFTHTASSNNCIRTANAGGYCSDEETAIEYLNNAYSAFPSYSATDLWPGIDEINRAGYWTTSDGYLITNLAFRVIPQELLQTAASRETIYSSVLTTFSGDAYDGYEFYSGNVVGNVVNTENGEHLITTYSGRHTINTNLMTNIASVTQYIIVDSDGVVTQEVTANGPQPVLIYEALAANSNCLGTTRYGDPGSYTRRPIVNRMGSYLSTNYSALNDRYKVIAPTLISEGSAVYYEHKFWFGSQVDDSSYAMETFSVSFDGDPDTVKHTFSGYAEVEHYDVHPSTFAIINYDFNYQGE